MGSNPYLARQMSGELAQDVINTVQAEYEKTDYMITYWHDLSIDTASDPELEAIGFLIGFPWPSVPAGTFDDNAFRFGDVAFYPSYSNLTGFGDTNTPGVGGALGSTDVSQDAFMPIDRYRRLLMLFAKLKTNGLSFYIIDQLASEYSTVHTMTYSATIAGDIKLAFQYDIGAGNIYVLQLIFDKVCTATRVSVVLEV